MKRKDSSKSGDDNAKGKKKKSPIRKLKKNVKKKSAKKKSAVKASKPSPKSKPKVVKKTAAKKTGAGKSAAKDSTSKPESKNRISRPKSFPELPVVREFGFPSEAPELPKDYHRDQLVLMTQNPDYLFSYWEITPERLVAKEEEKRQNEEYREAMKLNWQARSLFEDNYAILPVSLTARRWYLRVPFPGISYQVEIGWLGDKGHFISILDSNESESPESWDVTNSRLRKAGGILSYSSRISTPMGSSQQMRIEESVFNTLNWDVTSLPSSTTQRLKPSGKNKPADL